ncbi:MAG: helix-turn-helix domain-containing protein [Chloroflexi bacterium]|nr:helix-turn-helix domain-containing protein [Chloroflexota bacterium]
MAHMSNADVHDGPGKAPSGTPAAGDRGIEANPSDLARLVRISRLYYQVGETQDEIARRFGITRPHVSKLLKQARASGVVEIRIYDGLDRPDAVAEDLRRRFGLRAVHLAPALEGSDVLTRRRVGQLAADVLLGAIRNGMVVGVGDGASMTALADAIDSGATPTAATIVPLCGGFWSSQVSREPFRRIADALGATPRGLLAPGLLDDGATRDALAAHAGIRAVTDLWAGLDVAAFGIGSPAWSEASVGREAFAELEAAEAIGEVLIAPFDIEGRFVGESMRQRVIAFDARHLADVSASIGVASGRAKVRPIVGALRAGIVGTLVTDVDTAAAVLGLDRDEPATIGPRRSEAGDG